EQMAEFREDLTRTRQLGEEVAQRTSASKAPAPFFLPGNTSATALVETLNDNPHALIHETELQTLDASLRGGTASGREALRQGFHDETISLNRSTKASVTVRHPAPSAVLSGTPGQAEAFFSGDEGLFSRVALYRFDIEPTWISQVGTAAGGNGARPTDALAECLARARIQLARREDPLPVTFTSEAAALIDRPHEWVMDQWTNGRLERTFKNTLFRSGLRAARIAGILCLVRRAEAGVDLSTESEVVVPAPDTRVGTRISLTHLVHSARFGTTTELELGERSKPWEPLKQLLPMERKLYDELHDLLMPRDYISCIAREEFGIRSEAELNRLIQKLLDCGLLRKTSARLYRKVHPYQRTSTPPAAPVAKVLGSTPAAYDPTVR
ncbi:MAG: DUF3987 domain-containing protein, partial [Salinivenus sp.]